MILVNTRKPNFNFILYFTILFLGFNTSFLKYVSLNKSKTNTSSSLLNQKKHSRLWMLDSKCEIIPGKNCRSKTMNGLQKYIDKNCAKNFNDENCEKYSFCQVPSYSLTLYKIIKIFFIQYFFSKCNA